MERSPDAQHDGETLGEQLSATVASAAGPYGYTISLGGSFAMSNGQLGAPDLGQALLFMVGGVAAFVALELIATRSLAPRAAPADAPRTVWDNAHVASAGTALCAVWGVIHLFVGGIAWLLAGFAATAAYFGVTALQRIAIRRLRRC